MATMTGYLTLTQANIDHGSMYLSPCIGIFPQDAIGGANRSDAALQPIQIWHGSAVEITDIDGEKKIFRRRAWVRQFFRDNGVVAGDRILLEQLSSHSYRVS
jgi:DNA polymerase III subunit epsilon